MTNKNRVTYIDAVSGLLIIAVVNIHIGDWNWVTKVDCPSWYTSIDLFFMDLIMPWFFFKSGLFYKKFDNTTDKIKYDISKLIIPFLKYSLIGQLIYSLRMYFEFHETNLFNYFASPIASVLLRGSLSGNFALWFFIALFGVRAIFNYFNVKRINILLILMFFVGLLVFYNVINSIDALPVLPGKENSRLPLWLGSIAFGGMFYSMGYIFRELQFNKIIIALTVLICCVYSVVYLPWYSFRAGFIQIHIIPIYLIFMTACVIGLIIFFKYSPYHWPVLQEIGKHSMLIYVLHTPLLTVSRLLFFSLCGVAEGWTLRSLQSVFIFFVFLLIIIGQKHLVSCKEKK